MLSFLLQSIYAFSKLGTFTVHQGLRFVHRKMQSAKPRPARADRPQIFWPGPAQKKGRPRPAGRPAQGSSPDVCANECFGGRRLADIFHPRRLDKNGRFRCHMFLIPPDTITYVKVSWGTNQHMLNYPLLCQIRVRAVIKHISLVFWQ